MMIATTLSMMMFAGAGMTGTADESGHDTVQTVRNLAGLELYAEAHDVLMAALRDPEAPIERLARVGWVLGTQHTPTHDAMLSYRDTLADTVLHDAGAEDLTTIEHLAALDRGLQQTSHTVEVYDRLRRLYPDASGVAHLRRLSFEQLVADGRYHELHEAFNLVAEADRVMCDRLVTIDPRAPRAEQDLARRQRSALVHRIALNYETLVAVNDLQGAARVAEKALRIDSSGSTYHTLAWYGCRSGQPSERCATFARMAAERMPDNPNTRDTLMRIAALRDVDTPIRGLTVSRRPRSGF